MIIFTFVFFFVILAISITFHEYAHGWVANKLGDPTPKTAGRLTLNPLAHIDPFGTIALPVMLLFVSTQLGYPFAIGYAKPVPINPYHFKNPKRDMLWVGLAGPLANFIVAGVLSLMWRMNMVLFPEVIKLGIFLNLVLALFNLIPIPPLDGSRIISSFLPNQWAYKYSKIEPYGFVIILILITTGFFRLFILPLAKEILNYLLGVGVTL